MPRTAWIEIRDPTGGLLASIPARIRGGTVTAELPTFPPNTRGSIELCTDEEEPLLEEREVRELPMTPQMLIVQMG
jgi:hypothetical protein